MRSGQSGSVGTPIGAGLLSWDSPILPSLNPKPGYQGRPATAATLQPHRALRSHLGRRPGRIHTCGHDKQRVNIPAAPRRSSTYPVSAKAVRIRVDPRIVANTAAR